MDFNTAELHDNGKPLATTGRKSSGPRRSRKGIAGLPNGDQTMLQDSNTAVTQSAVASVPTASLRKPQEVQDRELALAVITSMHAFQDAIDKAIMSGLIVEPSFQSVGNRFSNAGVSSESYLAKCKIYRQLS